jgi:hypothetical protein
MRIVLVSNRLRMSAVPIRNAVRDAIKGPVIDERALEVRQAIQVRVQFCQRLGIEQL